MTRLKPLRKEDLKAANILESDIEESVEAAEHAAEEKTIFVPLPPIRQVLGSSMFFNCLTKYYITEEEARRQHTHDLQYGLVCLK